MSLDSALFYAGLVVEAAVILVLFFRKITRILPIFSLYIAYSLFNDLAMLLVRKHFPEFYPTAFSIEMPLDSVLQFGVLVELAWSVLRPYRAILPRAAIFVIAIFVLLAAAVAWPVTSITVLHNLPASLRTLVRLQQTFSILRILFFLAIAGLGQLFAIGWRNRELQVATGLGFFSLVSMGAAFVQTHSVSAVQLQATENLVAASYVCSMLYWSFSFIQKEAPRQEFSPKMQSILLAVAGTARANRLAANDFRKPKP